MSNSKKTLTPLKAIRSFCLRCNGGAYGVEVCPSTKCHRYHFRFGKLPQKGIKYEQYHNDSMPTVVETDTSTTAIRRACLECVGWSKKDVRECTVPECEMYPLRFGKSLKKSKANRKSALARGKHNFLVKTS